MRKKITAAIVVIIILSIGATCNAQQNIRWKAYNAGFFSIEIPEGWEVRLAGDCSMFSFIIADPQNPIRRIFYFGQVGPFYLQEQQRQIDYNYLRIGGFPIQWINMPSINPLTTENFFRQFYLIARDPVSKNFIQGIPNLSDFQVVSAAPQTAFMPGFDSKIVRGVFRDFNTIGEGLFYGAVGIFTPFDGVNPGVGTGMGYLCAGISSYKKDFSQWESVLLRCLNSLKIDPVYIQRCMQMSDRIWNSISQINKIWDDISNMIDKSWENKKRVDDISSERFSDAISGVERLRDPDTGEVYEVGNKVYEDYLLNPQRYKKTNLEPLGNDDWDSWTKPTTKFPW